MITLHEAFASSLLLALINHRPRLPARITYDPCGGSYASEVPEILIDDNSGIVVCIEPAPVLHHGDGGHPSDYRAGDEAVEVRITQTVLERSKPLGTSAFEVADPTSVDKIVGLVDGVLSQLESQQDRKAAWAALVEKYRIVKPPQAPAAPEVA